MNRSHIWIPVSESLPPVGKVVLAFTRYSIQLCVRQKIGDMVRDHPNADKVIWYPSNYSGGEVPVTHWMPLPDPPERRPEPVSLSSELAAEMGRRRVPLTTEVEQQVSKIFENWQPTSLATEHAPTETEVTAVIEEAIRIFGTRHYFWLDAENQALGSKTPRELLKTADGVKLVSDVLGRITHGVFE